MMQIEKIEYADGQQRISSLLIYDANVTQTQKPAVILFPAFEGLSEFVIDYGKRIAAEGYVAFVADIYGDAQTADTIEGCFNLIQPFLQDRSLVRRRAILAYEALLQQSRVAKEQIGAVGFCFGGMCVLELARSGAHLKAAVSMHGVLAKSELTTHPIKSHLLILHGYEDPQIPPSCLAPFAEEMKAAGVADWTFTFFGEAKHSFTDPKTGSFDPEREKTMGREYNEAVANRCYRYAVDFFKELL